MSRPSKGSICLMDWKQRAHALAAIATPPGSRWRAPLAATPRHTFVPRWWEPDDGGWALRDGAGDPPRWLSAVYSDRTLVTRVGSLHADHADLGTRTSGRPTSSSTLPGLVTQMFRHASIDDSCTVLDVATVSVRPVPPSWLGSLTVGGRLATTITGMSVILTAEKQEDGTAIGRIERDQAMFMRTRSESAYPADDGVPLSQARVEEGDHVERGRYPVLDVVEAWNVRTMVEILTPGIVHHYARQDGIRTAVMAHPDGSWARAEQRGDEVIVHQSGPRRLWDGLDEVRDHWIRYGELPFRGARVLIEPDGVIHLRRGRWTATIGPCSATR